MASTVTIDLRQIARGLDIPLRQIQAAVELLDEGNTVPFITRYRKDQTEGLDEEQIREIQDRLAKLRLLAERKQTILRSIDSQGKLTERLAKQILGAATTKRLEDLYLPYKPKKQTLATLARSRGLEELAQEILAASPSCADLDARARDFANSDRHVPTGADALLGAGHILAEQFSERAELRQQLREVLQRTGKIATTRIGGTEAAEAEPAKMQASQEAVKPQAGVPPAEAPQETPQAEDVAKTQAEAVQAAAPPVEVSQAETSPTEGAVESQPVDPPATIEATSPIEVPAAAETPVEAAMPSAAMRAQRAKEKKAAAKAKKEELKKRLEEKKIKAFRDYFNYSEEIKKIPPHRTLAINRGERARVLRVKLDADLEAMYQVLEELVPSGHPHAGYLRGCARDSLARLILPGLEREIRRELTDRAEAHAVGVFAKNLRNLLLQPPIRGRRVLAVDPGFKSGCKLVALDGFGRMLAHDVIYLIGKGDRRAEAQKKVVEMVRQHELSVVAIGNGTACRESEDFLAAVIESELRDQGVAYVIVNEAGASVYSTSQAGREELPDCDATLRGAISIGRRLQDPLSELVKIEPANIGVGLYQHDVKAKHLQASLDEVVESCVNYVGVDVNTASPALLRYVSGLNQLTARRVYEYRCQQGPLRSREQLHAIPGIGEATFVQAAGFLKITGGDNPLDATWIHPESYAVATRVMAKLGCEPAALDQKEAGAALAQQIGGIDLEAMAKELEVGVRTLQDILSQLLRPGRDPREDLPAPVFKQGILKLEDLSPGMELTGTVLNVVDFGCFVDIGMHDSGLVHVSHMADRFIRDPHEVVAVGNIVKVWVLEVDRERRRVSLTMVPPGTERPRRPVRGPQPAEGQPDQDRGPRRRRRRGGRSLDGQPQPAGPQSDSQGQARPPRPQGGPPPRGRRPGGLPPGRPQPPRPKPKPLIPITDAMKKGKEPMRTFGDLLQFYEHKQTDDPKPAAAKKPAPDLQNHPSVDAPDTRANEEATVPPSGESVALAAAPPDPPPSSDAGPSEPPPSEA